MGKEVRFDELLEALADSYRRELLLPCWNFPTRTVPGTGLGIAFAMGG